MFLFLDGIGGMEIILIMFVILMFFGTKSIPGISRTLGKAIRELRDATQGIQDEIRSSTQDIKDDYNKTTAQFKSEFDISKEVEATKSQIKNSSFSEDLKEIKSGLESTTDTVKSVTKEI